MPGLHVTDRQVRRYMSSRREGHTQAAAAARAGFSERTGRRIEARPALPSQKEPRSYRTRPDPFARVWREELLPLLAAMPNIRATTLLEQLNRRHPGLDVIFIESGGDNLAATFSPELADLTLYVISVCQGEKIPRKGGPAITRSDLLIVNKMDLAPHVGADLDIMASDTKRARGERPYIFTDLLRSKGVPEVVAAIETMGGLSMSQARA